MAAWIPFRGIRFDTGKAGAASLLLAPPYDVIDEGQRAALCSRSPYNIVRLIRADPSNGYAEAAKRVAEWRATGVLRSDEVPAFYVYEQAFRLGERDFQRTGVVGLVALDASGRNVMPHERTLSGPRSDRLNLLSATRMTFGQVFALYTDRERAADRVCERAKAEAPLAEAANVDGMGHRLWAVTAPEETRLLREALASRRLLIADGHHRYATALNFMRRHPELPGARWRMVTLVNTESAGLLVLPIHRVVKRLTGYSENRLLENMQEDFEIVCLPAGPAGRRAAIQRMHGERAEGRHAFGMLTGDGLYRLAILRERGRSAADSASPVQRLDVTILHRLILEKQLGIDAARLESGDNLEFVRDLEDDAAEAAVRVEKGECQAAFFVNAVRIDEIEAVAAAGERMPQKTTYFYPKVYTGFVMHDLTGPVDYY